MKKIWLLNHHASTPVFGGSTRHYDFAVELANRGYDTTLIASSFSHDKRSYLFEDEYHVEKVNNRCRVIWLRTSPEYFDNGINRFRNMISYYYLVRKYYKRLSLDYGIPDVSFGSSVHPFAWLAASYVAGRSKAEFIIEVRDLWPKGLVEVAGVNKNHPIIYFFKAFEIWAYKKAKYIVTTMPYADRYICDELKIDKKKVVWIGHGISCDSYEKNKVLYKTDLPKEIVDFIGNNFCCIFTGAFAKSQGVFELINAAKIIQESGRFDIKFVLVGSGVEEAEMKDTIRRFSLNNILLFPKMPKTYVPPLLDRGDVCISSLLNRPIYKYGLTLNKMNDYMCSGKPIIFATNIKDNVVELSGDGIVVNPEDSEALVDGILKIYNMSGEERRKMGENGKRYVKENNDMPILVTKLEKLFFK